MITQPTSQQSAEEEIREDFQRLYTFMENDALNSKEDRINAYLEFTARKVIEGKIEEVTLLEEEFLRKDSPDSAAMLDMRLNELDAQLQKLGEEEK